MSDILTSTKEHRYIAVQQRLDRVNSVGAIFISGLTAIALWGKWRDLAIAVSVQLAILPFNFWLTRSLLGKFGVSKAETLRTAVNLTATVLICHFAHWPEPVWLWLPFVALAFDHVNGRISWTILAAMIVATDVMALIDGVAWLYPLTFSCFAIF